MTTTKPQREGSMGGDDFLYYSIFRLADGYECTSSYTSDTSPVRTYIGYLKERVDNELAEDDPWGEKSDQFTT
jgi:hypothetical protein